MKIKKQIKKEKAKRKNIVYVSLVVMALLPYLVIVLNDQKIFQGWESYFAFSFVILVELLLIANIIRITADNIFDMTVSNQRIRIKDNIIRAPLIVQTDKVAYVGVLEKAHGDFEILVLIEKGKRNKKLVKFDEEFIKANKQYSNIYSEFIENNAEKEFYTYIIRKTGAKKYYYLYLLYKNAYQSRFTKEAVNYVKRFMEEYNLS